MAEDIQLGADVSDAIQALGKVGNAFQEIASSAGASDKAVNAAMRNIERSIGGVVADLSKAQSAFASFGKGGMGPGGGAGIQLAKGVTQGFQAARRESDAYQRSLTSLLSVQEREAAQSKAMASAQMRLNSAGRFIGSGTGRFVGPEGVNQYMGQVTLAERLVNAERQYASAKELSTKQQMLENNLASKFHGVQDDIVRQRERSTRQQQLETAFASRFYGIADQGAGVLRRTANVLQQIPPATWGQKMAMASSAAMNMSNSTRYAMYDVSASAGVAGAALVGLGALALRAAISHERAFANVQRTTQTSTEGYALLKRQLEQMAMTLPITYEEITQIATAAGQLGISASGIATFTSTVAKLTATTNLTSEAAGIALARFRAFFAETGQGVDKSLAVTETTFSNLASSILKVGVNSIASETGIVNVATQIASMGAYSGMTANQVVGLAGALASIGVAPELSRGTITRTFSLIGTAVSKGGEDLDKFAKLAGISSDQFKAAWGTDKFAGVFTDMMTGLYNVTKSGEDANLMLMDLGFNSVRDRPLLLRLATAANEAGEAGGLLSQTMGDALAGWTQNSELALQYSIVSKTTAARIQVLGQAFEQLFATMGGQSSGLLGELASGLTDFIRGIEGLSQSGFGQFLGTVGTQAALLAGGLLLVVAMGARTVASLQGIGVAWTAMSTRGITSLRGLSAAFKVANLSMGILGIVAAIGGAIAGFVAMNEASKKSTRAMQDVGGLVAAMEADYKAGGTAIKGMSESSADAAKEQAKLKRQASDMTEALYGTADGANSAGDGMSNLASKAGTAALAVGDATRAFYRAQLQQSEGFQKLFNPDTTFGRDEFSKFMGQGVTLKELGLDPKSLDWDLFMRQSIEGTFDKDKLLKELADDLDIDKYVKGSKGRESDLTKEYVALRAVVGEIDGQFGDLSGEIQGAAGASAAFGATSQEALGKVAAGTDEAGSGWAELSEEQRKALESMASGMLKFADTGNLIKLTQQMNDIFGQEGVASADKAAQWEKAWSDAYGGAAFSMESYLGVYRRAAEEQTQFSSNLQDLAARGLDWTIIQDLAAMGPEANRLVQALVNGTDAQLQEFQGLWGQTGRDSMIQLAAQMEEGQYIVRNVMATGGIEALRSFNRELASGKGVPEALAAIQHDMDGNKLQPKSNTPDLPNLTWAQRKIWEEQNRLNLHANVTIRTTRTGDGFSVNGRQVSIPGSDYATGGWTGPGSRLTPAGTVHADEFVFTKRATNAIGVGNLYALMRRAESGTKAPRGRGYANGGLVGGGRTTLGYGGQVDLSPQTIQQIGLVMDKILQVDGRAIGRTSSRSYVEDSKRGAF